MYSFFKRVVSAWIIIRVKSLCQDQSGSTTADIYSFGNKSAPRGARPQQDFNVENFDSIVGYNEFNELYKSLPWQYGGKK